MKNFICNRKAFSMLELVFVIIVMGILAAFALPRLDRDTRQEAADTIISTIRYAQHQAINDYRQRYDSLQWQMSFWQFYLGGCSDNGVYFGIGSDGNYNGVIELNEAAVDPANGLPMFYGNLPCERGGDGSVSANIFATKRFDVSSMVGTGGCNGVQNIFFDHLGRPHVGVTNGTSPAYGSYMDTECIFEVRFNNNDDSLFVHILPESGFAFVEDQNGS